MRRSTVTDSWPCPSLEATREGSSPIDGLGDGVETGGCVCSDEDGTIEGDAVDDVDDDTASEEV